ncbi:MAG: DUF4832 domain-containing protein [Paludibacteraceae bacterium]|nr:DUF4832 domain-containing protein [Paludibacteraceae bacterium]
MKRLVSFLLCLFVCLCVCASRISYTADDKTIFPNPERGFTEELNKVVTVKNPYIIKSNESFFSNTSSLRKSMSLVVVLYNYRNFKSQDLPEEILLGFDEDMQILRQKGWKCVLRFAYTETESDNVDATPDWVERHLSQLKPYIEKNADVIYVMEAGFVGVWGEWYYTENYGNESQHMNANRRRVVDALMATAPKDMFVCFRYPMLKQEYLGDKTPLSSEEAYTGTVRARMAHHNDAFLNSWGDMGTYASSGSSDDPNVRQYISDETLYLPNGGETNIEESADAEKRATYEKTIDACSKYHWTFCGSSYAQATTGKWRREGTFDEMNRRLGYRFQLRETTVSDSVAPGGKCNVTMLIKNNGFAPLYNKRVVYLVLKNGSDIYQIPLQSDPRRWLPNGCTALINEQVDIPSDIEQGRYDLYIYMPDAHASIAGNPRYAVRFANEDIWDEDTGMNSLNATIAVSADAPLDPGQLPEITGLDNLHNMTQSDVCYDLLGRKVSPDCSGIVICNGKKLMLR